METNEWQGTENSRLDITGGQTSAFRAQKKCCFTCKDRHMYGYLSWTPTTHTVYEIIIIIVFLLLDRMMKR